DDLRAGVRRHDGIVTCDAPVLMHLASGRIPLDVGLPAFHASSSWFSVNRDERGLCRETPGATSAPGRLGGRCLCVGSGVPERHAREELVEVHVLGWSGI